MNVSTKCVSRIVTASYLIIGGSLLSFWLAVYKSISIDTIMQLLFVTITTVVLVPDFERTLTKFKRRRHMSSKYVLGICIATIVMNTVVAGALLFIFVPVYLSSSVFNALRIQLGSILIVINSYVMNSLYDI